MTDFPFPIHQGLEINFENADIDFELENVERTSAWLSDIITKEASQVAQLNYIFCSDDYLHKINLAYLDHDTLTDIITFPLNDDPIQGDIYISINRVKENANTLSVSFQEELHRVIVHGLLHLVGYNDKTPEENADMRAKEDSCLQLIGYR